MIYAYTYAYTGFFFSFFKVAKLRTKCIMLGFNMVLLFLERDKSLQEILNMALYCHENAQKQCNKLMG